MWLRWLNILSRSRLQFFSHLFMFIEDTFFNSKVFQYKHWSFIFRIWCILWCSLKMNIRSNPSTILLTRSRLTTHGFLLPSHYIICVCGILTFVLVYCCTSKLHKTYWSYWLLTLNNLYQTTNVWECNVIFMVVSSMKNIYTL